MLCLLNFKFSFIKFHLNLNQVKVNNSLRLVLTKVLQLSVLHLKVPCLYL